jgi:hypothetical protein
MTITWKDGDPWTPTNATLGHTSLSTAGTVSFRCMGPASTPAPKAGLPADAFVLPRSGVAYDAKDRSVQKWAAAHDTCAFFGGHLAPPVDLMEAVFGGLPAGGNVKLWTANQAGFNGSQFLASSVQWLNAAPRAAWDSSNAAGWISKASAGQPFRCAYYPVDEGYKGPEASQCNGACFAVPAPVGSAEKGTTLWVDALDRGNANLASAIADCHKNGGRLPGERDYTEAIRAGLPNGSNTHLYTSDFAVNTDGGARRVHIVRWSNVETAYDDQYSKYMTWSDFTTLRPYRCMWTSEHR